MGFLIAGIGIYLAVARPRQLRRPMLTGVILAAAGLAASVVRIYVLIPAFGGRSGYYWAYGARAATSRRSSGTSSPHPLSSLRILVTPRVKVNTVLWLLGAFCFLPLRSPITLAAVPLLLERMLDSKFPNWWVTSFHYNAYLVIILVFAAVDGAARLDRWSPRPGVLRSPARPPRHRIHRARPRPPAYRYGRAGLLDRDGRRGHRAGPAVRVRSGPAPVLLPPDRVGASGGRGRGRGAAGGHGRGGQLRGPASVRTGHRPAVRWRRGDAGVLPVGGRRRGTGSSPSPPGGPSGSGSRCWRSTVTR